MNKIKEKIILTKIKAGDQNAFAELYDFYVDKIYRFIYFKVPTTNDAEDLTSEVFLRVWQYIRDNIEIDNLKAFLYRVSRNAVIDFYRKNNKKETMSLDSVEVIDTMRTENLIEKIDNSIKIEKIYQKLDKLKEEYREVILFRFVDEYSIKEIAEIMGKSKGAIRVLLHRALEKIR